MKNTPYHLALFAAALLLSLPVSIASHTEWVDYGDGYGRDGSRGRSYESYSRNYDTTRSDIGGRTVTSSLAQTFPASPSSSYGYYGPGPNPSPSYYDGFYTHQPYGIPSYSSIPPYPYDPSSGRSYTYTDNFNRQYSERTNEAIKVDRYTAYDDLGLVHLVSDGYYGRRAPYFVAYDSYTDPYVYRYPYSGYSTGDRGYASQSYYSRTPADGQPIIVPRIPPSPQRLAAPIPLSRVSDDGPSQTYLNTITDRGPLYAPLNPLSPLSDQRTFEQAKESGGASRNPQDRSVYGGQTQRDTMYVYSYGEGRRP